MVGCSLTLLILANLTLVRSSPLAREEEIIDGRKTTIALAVAHYLVGLIPNETVQDLLNSIISAFEEEEFDYWGEVKDQVEELVGIYINEHNMHQVEVYQSDLETLMDRYNNAPIESDGTYPDKNQQAAALHASILSHRYLTEAALYPESMILHFQDISSIHSVILKDAAETYSFEGYPPSAWWIDLNEAMDHYITYGTNLRSSLITWRMEQVTCEVITGRNYDEYFASDLVTGEVSKCIELHETDSCANHCDLFVQHKQQSVDLFTSSKVNDVMVAWKKLKQLAEENAPGASRFYDPREGH